MTDLATIEADKYRRIWAQPEYRRISPGMMEVERAFAFMGLEAGASLIDFGAGTGRATAWFRDKGLDVLAVDFAENALEASVPLVVSNLWDMGEAVPPADYGFCCDVMEHIPADKVVRVLAGIRNRVRQECWFRIATRPDRMGALIGETLHLTVQSGDWWRVQVEAHFSLVDVIENTGRDVVLLARV